MKKWFFFAQYTFFLVIGDPSVKYLFWVLHHFLGLQFKVHNVKQYLVDSVMLLWMLLLMLLLMLFLLLFLVLFLLLLNTPSHQSYPSSHILRHTSLRWRHICGADNHTRTCLEGRRGQVWKWMWWCCLSMLEKCKCALFI